MFKIGIDVGGMSIKGGIVSNDGKIIYKSTSKIIDKNAMKSLDYVITSLVLFARENMLEINDVGIGIPCVFDKKTGVVSYGNNINFGMTNLKEYFLKKYNLNLEIANDAMAAALGEYRYGNSKGYHNSVLITIGTGIGCGIILDGKIIKSNSSAIGELGHTIIQANGRKCSCGKHGCVEAYCSMTALYKDLRREMLLNKNSTLWNKIDVNNIDGKTFFELLGKDETADKVFDRFIKYLGITVMNVANLLRPDIILIGGGVSAQGEKVIKPINDFLSKNIFAKEYTQPIHILPAKNGNDAGILGAASLLY